MLLARIPPSVSVCVYLAIRLYYLSHPAGLLEANTETMVMETRKIYGVYYKHYND